MPYKDKLKEKEHRKNYYLKNKDKIIVQTKKRYEINAESKKAYAREYYRKKYAINVIMRKKYREKNKEKVRETIKKWLEIPENKEHVKQYKKKWSREYRKKNKGKVNAKTAKRYTIKKKATSPDADMQKIEVFYMLAEKLTLQTGVRYSVDHIKPLIKGGLHHQDNLQVITLEANIKKGSKYPYEFGSESVFFPESELITYTHNN